MLDTLRKASESWLGRIFMALVLGVIVVSFAIWGIGDIFQGFGSGKLAAVGGQTITTQDYRTAYQNQLEQLERQERRVVTSQEAHAIGLDAQVLSSLVADAVLDQQAHDLGLAISQKQVGATIQNDPSFKGPDGKFDAAAFQNLLQQNNMTQATFLAQQRDVDLRREIADALIGALKAPRPMVDAVDQFRDETRSVDYFVVNAAAAGTIPQPTEAQLADYFKVRKQEWRAPEYRSLVVLAITPESVADPSSVSDAAAQAYYDQHKAEYGQPEKRQILQATFPTKQDAQAAAAKAQGGEDFAAAVKDEKGTLVNLGLVLRSGIFDPVVAQAAFSAPSGGLSAPVQAPFGWIVVKAASVQPASFKPFADMAPAIKKTLALQSASTKISSLHQRIEDQRTDGKTLTQAAKAVGLKVEDVAAVDAQGLGKDGEAVALPDKDDLLKAAFASDVGMDNDVLSTHDGGYVWFEVAAVAPAHDRTLAEAKPQVTAAWKADQLDDRLSSLAGKIVAEVNAGGSLDAIAKTYDTSAKTFRDVKRIGTTDLPAPVVAQIFNVKVHQAGSAAPAPGSRAIFQVNDSVTPPVDPSSTINQAIAADLKQQMGDDLLSQYLEALQAHYGVSVNQAELQAAVSGSAQQ